ncbi:MAG: gephyrin-like molybdotransferase Glp [Actinomycetes bacterium]
MRTVDEQLAVVLDGVHPLTELDLTLLDAQGCVLAEDVVAESPLPPFDNAAADGYAVRLEDVASASPARPVTLPVVGDVGPGSTSAYSVQSGFTVRMAAGAPLPAGAEAVVPVGTTDGGIAQVRIDRAPQPGESIRRAGEDVVAGQVVLPAGAHIGSQQVAVLAAVGRGRVRARPRPRVVVVAVGGQYAEAGAAPLGGQVHDASTPALTAAAIEAGAIAYRVGAVPEDPQTLMGLLEDQLIRADVVVVCGGGAESGAGALFEALARLGTVSVEQVAMHPGAVQGFGTIGPDATPIFTVPGDPVAAYIAFEIFVRPALRRMIGVEATGRPQVRATATAALRGRPGARWFVPARLEVKQGSYVISPAGTAGRTGEHVSALAKANSLAIVPESTGEVHRGEAAAVIMLERRHG